MGIISEPLINEAVVGELAAAIIGSTFSNVRNGDRFWYENAYSSEIIGEIKATSFGEIIRRNSAGSNIPDNVFRTQPPSYRGFRLFGFPY